MSTKQSNTPDTLNAADVAKAKAAIAIVAEADGKATETIAEQFAILTALYVVSGVIVTDIRKQLTTLNREEYIRRAKAKLGRDLSEDERAKVVAVANATFSRAAKPFEPKRDSKAGRPAATPTQTAQNAATTGATANKVPSPSDVTPSMMARLQGMAASLAKAETELANVQAYVSTAKVPKAVQESIVGTLGEITESVHRTFLEFGEIFAELMPAPVNTPKAPDVDPNAAK